MPSTRFESLLIGNTNDSQVRRYFLTTYREAADSELGLLFAIAMNDMSLFPSINMPEGETWQQFIDRWVESYEKAYRNPPSGRTATPKSSCTDPIIKEIVRVSMQISDAEATAMESSHTLFMSAENCQGGLLEEYIDSVIAPLGWVWCRGNALRSVDFCTGDGRFLLQVKNKSNTENSSSSAIRVGTSIRKWYRLGTRSVLGERIPDYRWQDLNKIIFIQSRQHANLSEDGYLAFIRHVVSENREIVTDR